MKKYCKKITSFDLTALLRQSYQKADKPFLSAFCASFLALVIIFTYHSAGFLFGDHDWRYLKEGIELGAGLFEGRFAQFLLINALSQGEILPIINNLLGFAGFSLGIALLAKYWQLPKTQSAYIFFALFTAITPYILSFMYFAFLIAPVLSWNAVIIGALLISESESEIKKKKKNQSLALQRLLKTLFSALLITLALGGYPPVINLIATAFAARLLIAVLYEKMSFKKLCQKYVWTVINILLGLLLYKLCLLYLTHINVINSNYYNLQTTPFNEWGSKAVLVLKDLFLQFGATLPFITASYKICLSLITLLAVAVLFQKKNKLLSVPLFIGVFLAALITLFLSTSIKETEFSPRIDFFGFMYAIAATFAIILKTENKFIKNIASLVAVFSILISANTLFEAQKVWKLGFDAELKLYQRVAKRFQTHPNFNQYGHYIIVQNGMPTFRHHFYHEKFRYPSDDLLGMSYVPTMASGVMWNYYGIYEYADTTSYTYTFQPDDEFKQQLQTALPYPDLQSIHVGSNWILLPMTKEGLEALRHRYLP